MNSAQGSSLDPLEGNKIQDMCLPISKRTVDFGGLKLSKEFEKFTTHLSAE